MVITMLKQATSFGTIKQQPRFTDTHFFTYETTRREYERMRRIARFWRVYHPQDCWVQPPDFYSEFWQLFSPIRPANQDEPLQKQADDFDEIPF